MCRRYKIIYLAWDYDSCCLFSAKDGKFIRRIGHKGDDPEAVFSFYENFYNPYDGLLYFQGVEGIRVKYGWMVNMLVK